MGGSDMFQLRFDDEPTQPLRAAPLEVAIATASFHRELVELQIECDQFARALEPLDPIALEITAWDLSYTWRSARLAYDTLVITATSFEQRLANLALLAGQRTTSRLLAHACSWLRAAAPTSLALHALLLRVYSAIQR